MPSEAIEALTAMAETPREVTPPDLRSVSALVEEALSEIFPAMPPRVHLENRALESAWLMRMPRPDLVRAPDDISGSDLAEVMRSLEVNAGIYADMVRTYTGLLSAQETRRAELARHRAEVGPIRRWADALRSEAPDLARALTAYVLDPSEVPGDDLAPALGLWTEEYRALTAPGREADLRATLCAIARGGLVNPGDPR